MGLSPAHAIEQAGQHLLRLLMNSPKLPYSTFFDGTEEMHNRLCTSIGLADDWYCAEHLVDLAVFELEEMGIVETEVLTSNLPDGERDYMIELTADGRKAIKSGFTPIYWDAE